jgi:hypothetical protein
VRPSPTSRAFHATLEASGEVTVRRVNPTKGVPSIFMFKDAEEMRIVLSECYKPEDLQILFHDLNKIGSVIFHASLKIEPKK